MKHWIVFFSIFLSIAEATVSLGIDLFLEQELERHYAGKRIGLIINQTSITREMVPTWKALQERGLKIVAIFSPEHGFKGAHYAAEKIEHSQWHGIPVYSLHGKTRRPTPDMLRGLDVVIYDIQCTGVRAYTYSTTLFYFMEEAAKSKIEIIVLDRPNPINGVTVDGPLLEEKWRSFLGYINVPYCHGMTIGELAHFFREEYQIDCPLRVVSMQGWKRSMSYRDTGLPWIPPSPNVPEADTPLYCPTTGILGELKLVNIGIGCSLPFKIVGAPWINGETFAAKLNAQHLPGVHFQPFFFRPFWGRYKGVNCEGVQIHITDAKIYRPLSIQYLILGMLKSLYPQEFSRHIQGNESTKDLFCKVNGSEQVYTILLTEKFPAWKLIEWQSEQRSTFLHKRQKYLLYEG
jgi:uncharacterized protein YbbC (DUF1343 family)